MIPTHRTRRDPHQTVVVVEETDRHVTYHNADLRTLPRALFDECYVAIEARAFIPRGDLEELVEAIDDGALLTVGDVASAIRRVIVKGAA